MKKLLIFFLSILVKAIKMASMKWLIASLVVNVEIQMEAVIKEV